MFQPKSWTEVYILALAGVISLIYTVTIYIRSYRRVKNMSIEEKKELADSSKYNWLIILVDVLIFILIITIPLSTGTRLILLFGIMFSVNRIMEYLIKHQHGNGRK